MKRINLEDFKIIGMIILAVILIGVLLALIWYSVKINGGGWKEFLGSTVFYIGVMIGFSKAAFK